MAEDIAGLVRHVVTPLVAHPDEVRVAAVEGTASVIYELRVHPDDLDAVRGPKGKHLKALQQLLAVAGGPRKPVLDLIEPEADGAEE